MMAGTFSLHVFFRKNVLCTHVQIHGARVFRLLSLVVLLPLDEEDENKPYPIPSFPPRERHARKLNLA